ncbi:MAG: hypothetical protein MJZ37_02295 [Bacilli bacterium]|nr:hypothetical protein [Bacilli bacterium]
MKKLSKYLSFLFLSTLVVACGEENVIEPEGLTKTKLSYTYSDVCENYYRTSSAIPNQGDPNLLILPIYFTDSNEYIPSDKKEVVKKDIEQAFFGTKEELGCDSVGSYYSTLSSGKCNLNGTVSDWIEVDQASIEYSISETNTATFCAQVVDKYFEESHDNRSKYDLDKNGYLDGVIFIYGVPDHENFRNGSSYSNFWAYTNWTDLKANKDAPNICNFMWASYDFMYSKATARAKVGNMYGSGDNTYSTLDTHIFIHETGHMFGLVDYYDYSYQFSPAGGFSMQDHNVGSHDPYSVMALGWAEPYIPTESCSITINPFQSSRDCIILSNQWNTLNSPFDEYLMIEFFTPDGLNEFDHNHQYMSHPSGPSESGIRLWHVDARLLYNPYLKDASKVTCDPKTESGKVMHMMSNTYYGVNGRGYISPLGNTFANYNVLQLIRNEEVETYQPHNHFDKYSLFKDGSKFSMNTFAKQFVNSGKLNQGKVLGWTFTVSIENNQATINLTRTI